MNPMESKMKPLATIILLLLLSSQVYSNELKLRDFETPIDLKKEKDVQQAINDWHKCVEDYNFMRIRDSEEEVNLKEFENSKGFQICKKMLTIDANYIDSWSTAYYEPIEVVKLKKITGSCYYEDKNNHKVKDSCFFNRLGAKEGDDYLKTITKAGDYLNISNVIEARYFYKNQDNTYNVMSEFYEKIDGQWKIIGITHNFIDDDMNVSEYDRSCHEVYCINGCNDDVKTDCGLFAYVKNWKTYKSKFKE